MTQNTYRGFSLIELSIVLVIIGLLVGGVMAGQSLIRNADLKAVMVDAQRYENVVKQFRDQYYALPGDFSGATALWGAADATPASCDTTASTDGTTCDGDEDGQIKVNGSISIEHARAWQHLTNAGFIEGAYNGQASNGTGTALAKDEAPAGAFSSSVWVMIYHDNSDTGASDYDADQFRVDFGNSLHFLTEGSASNGLLTPLELESMDDKIDDGTAGGGRLFGQPFDDCGGGSSNTDTTAGYNKTSTAKECALRYSLGL